MEQFLELDPEGICPPGLDELLRSLIEHHSTPPTPRDPDNNPHAFDATREILSSLTIFHLANTIADGEMRGRIRGAAAEVLRANAQHLR